MKYLNFLLLISLASCVAEAPSVTIIGKWQDIYDYPTKEIVGNDTIYKTYPNIVYEFLTDSTYNVQNEKDWIIPPGGGTWKLSSDMRHLQLIPKPSILDSISNYKINYSWEIEMVSLTEMKAVHKLDGFSDTNPISFSFLRNFIKI
jgi:hypothetical protein